MLRTAQSLPLQGLLTLGFDPTRFPVEPPACYRASWQLPGPDSHRQATTSLSLSVHPKGLTSNCLGAHDREGYKTWKAGENIAWGAGLYSSPVAIVDWDFVGDPARTQELVALTRSRN